MNRTFLPVTDIIVNNILIQFLDQLLFIKSKVIISNSKLILN